MYQFEAYMFISYNYESILIIDELKDLLWKAK